MTPFKTHVIFSVILPAYINFTFSLLQSSTFPGEDAILPATAWAHIVPLLRGLIQADLELCGSSTRSQSLILLKLTTYLPLKTVHEEQDFYICSQPSCLTLPRFLFWITPAVSITDGQLFPTLLLPIWSGTLHSFALSRKENCIALKNTCAACLNKHTLKIPWYKLFLWHTSVAMVGSSPKSPIIAPDWKSVMGYGFYYIIHYIFISSWESLTLCTTVVILYLKQVARDTLEVKSSIDVTLQWGVNSALEESWPENRWNGNSSHPWFNL